MTITKHQKELAMLLDDTLQALQGSARHQTPITLGPSQAGAVVQHLAADAAREELLAGVATEAKRLEAIANTAWRTAEAKALNARDDANRYAELLAKERAAFAALTEAAATLRAEREDLKDLLVEEQVARAEWASRALATSAPCRCGHPWHAHVASDGTVGGIVPDVCSGYSKAGERSAAAVVAEAQS